MDGEGVGGDLQEGVAPQGREDPVPDQSVGGQAVEFRGQKILFGLR